MRAARFMWLVALAGCAQIPGPPTDARSALNTFCTLKQTQIAQVLLTPELLQAGRVVCNAIGDPLGVGG